MGGGRPYVRYLKRLNSDEQTKGARINFGIIELAALFLSHLDSIGGASSHVGWKMN
jgi:hypothetical protein